MSNWVRYRFEHLKRWRDYALKVAKAARDVLGDVRVYVVGGVAEGRTTVLSDIDILRGALGLMVSSLRPSQTSSTLSFSSYFTISPSSRRL